MESVESKPQSASDRTEKKNLSLAAQKTVADVNGSRANGSRANIVSFVQRQYEKLIRSGTEEIPFEIRFPSGAAHRIGNGEPTFEIAMVNERGLRALASFNELSIGEAYMNGDIDIEGDLLCALKLRSLLSDNNPVRRLLVTYVAPAFLGRVSSDRKWTRNHYEIDTEFFLLWLDKRFRGYSHGFFEDDAEPLDVGIERKFKFALEACRVKPGDRVLDIGGGWGSMLEYAGMQGIHVTSLTISSESQKYMESVIKQKALDCKVVNRHFLEYKPAERFDAILNCGVTEHLPDYRETIAQYRRLLKPGRRVYLDAYSESTKYGLSSFGAKWIFEGNAFGLCLHKYLAEVARTPFEVILIENDRWNYYLTTRKWAENLDAVRDTIVSRWGEHLYRRFRLYLWGCASSFALRKLGAHHMVLELPASV